MMRKKLLVLLASFFFMVAVFGQTTADFENLPLDSTGYWNGSDLSGGFSSGNAYFTNSFNTDWSSWTGWSYSNHTDTITSGWANQYAAKTGVGVDGSDNYAVFYFSGQVKITGDAAKGAVDGFYITNTTYAYNSMRDGDLYSKKFGGESGNDPDFFKLTIEKYLDGVLGEEKVEVYLADYRFEDNTQDFILSDWQWVDLTPLGNVDSLVFSLSSSDNGEFGMNTPAYFCVDNLVTHDGVVGVNETSALAEAKIFPNPAVDFVHIDFVRYIETLVLVEVFDMMGAKVRSQTTLGNNCRIDLRGLLSQQYIVKVVSRETGDVLFSGMVIKR